MSHFYLVLPSNSSKHYYPENTVTSYTTRLLDKIDLGEGEWECALVEIFFQKLWYNVGSDCTFSVSFAGYDEFKHNPGISVYSPLTYLVTFRIPSGYYKTISTLVDVITDSIATALTSRLFDTTSEPRTRISIPRDKWPRIRFNSTQRKVTIFLHPGSAIQFSDCLKPMLGFDDTLLRNESSVAKQYIAPITANVQDVIHSLYIYCDILENIAVGDTQAPLLRIVNATGEYGDVINKTFDPPRYIPVQKKRFDSIVIDIRSDIGEKIPFQGGHSMCILHFRRALSEHFIR
jgi:hypothetical protein